MVRFKLKADPAFTEHPLADGADSITVAALKGVITERKFNGSPGAFGLKLSNLDTGEEYAEDGMSVPAEASILIKRVPLSCTSSSSASALGTACSLSGRGAAASTGAAAQATPAAPPAAAPPAAAPGMCSASMFGGAIGPGAVSGSMFGGAIGPGACARASVAGRTDVPPTGSSALSAAPSAAADEPSDPRLRSTLAPALVSPAPSGMGAIGAATGDAGAGSAIGGGMGGGGMCGGIGGGIGGGMCGGIGAGGGGGGGAGFAEADEAEALKIKMLMGAAQAEWTRDGGKGGGRGGFGGGGYGGRGGGGFGGGGKGGGKGGADGAVGAPLRAPPPGYICFRCNKPGHFIAACPTNGDPKFDKPAKQMRAVGIPRSMLKRVVPTAAEGADGDEPRGGMVDLDGSSVKMVADDAQFLRTTEKSKAVLDSAALPDELRCPITKTLFRNAVLLPCCGASVSDDAIAQALVEDAGGAGATCVLCETKGVRIDEVLPNRQLRDAVAAFLADAQSQGGRGAGRKGAPVGRGGGGGQQQQAMTMQQQQLMAMQQQQQQQQQMQQQQFMQQQQVQQAQMQQAMMQRQQQAMMQQQQQQAMMQQQQQQQMMMQRQAMMQRQMAMQGGNGAGWCGGNGGCNGGMGAGMMGGGGNMGACGGGMQQGCGGGGQQVASAEQFQEMQQRAMAAKRKREDPAAPSGGGEDEDAW